MNYISALIMGLVQGLTEFLPVSSSAHLVFADHFLHIRLPDSDTVSFDVLLHLGTLLAVLIYFRKDVWLLLRGFGQFVIRPTRAWRENGYSRLAILLILGTIPAAVAGKTLKPFFENAFQNVPGTAVLLLVTAAMLFWISSRPVGGRNLEQANWKDALLIGIFQAIAILPGVSRSGSTITGGLMRGLDRDAAPRFSFLLSIPIILGGGLLDLKDMMQTGTQLTPIVMAIGFAAAAISGYAAVVILLGMVRKGRLDRFGYYCAIAGVGMLLYWTLLVPHVNTNRITGAAGSVTLGVNADGLLGPMLPSGAKWSLQLPVSSKVAPLQDVHFILDGKPLAVTGGDGYFSRGTGLYEFKLAPVYWKQIPSRGIDTDLWIVVRNKWGIQNDVRVRVHVEPPSLQLNPKV